MVTKNGDEVVGVVICDMLNINSSSQKTESSHQLPNKFIQLQTFFHDLSTKYGTDNVWDKVFHALYKYRDIYIVERVLKNY